MQIILRQDVTNLGKMGEIVLVKDGYARNYLIPKQMAYFASDGAVKRLEAEKRSMIKKRANLREQADSISQKLSEVEISIPMKVGEEGKLYGSVTQQMIADELKNLGFDIDKRNIIIEDTIRTLGVFDIKVKIHADVIANVKIWVISEEQ
jgi:large subunit ribosomal protein L9